MLALPFRWVLKLIYRAFSHGVFYLLLALGIRDVHTYQICHVSIDLWGHNLSTKS